MDSERMPRELRRTLLNEARRLESEANLIRHFLGCPYEWCERCCADEATLKAVCDRVWADPSGLRRVLGDALTIEKMEE